MKIKHVSENRFFWSLGRGEGDFIFGVELSLDRNCHLERTIFSRGKFGKESVIFHEEYSCEEFLELLRAEKELLLSARGDTLCSSGSKVLLREAMDRIRRVLDKLQ